MFCLYLGNRLRVLEKWHVIFFYLIVTEQKKIYGFVDAMYLTIVSMKYGKIMW